MATIEELMRATLLEVFNERDGDRRRAAIARIYSPEVRFADPEGTVVGGAALDAKAAKILDDAPGFVFTDGGPVHVVQNLGHCPWAFGPPGAAPVVRGIDVALVEDGLITQLWTMLTD